MKSLRKIYKHSLIAILFVIITSNAFAQAKSLRIFVIGNSFSGNATLYLQQLVKEGGYQLQIGRAELGGCSLQTHWENALAAKTNPDDPKSKPYKGKSIKQLLENGKWDFVTMQQYSKLSADAKTYQPYADSLYKFIKTIQPDAKIVWHQTWAYRSDAVNWGLINGNEKAKNDKEMYEKLTANYHAIAQRLNAGLIPTGAAFWKMRNDPVWGFVADTKEVIQAAVYPALPPQLHSINMGYRWDANNKLTFDPNHANEAGCYLGGLVWYHYFFGADLTKVKFKPAGIDEEFAKQLRLVAMAVFNENAAIMVK